MTYTRVIYMAFLLFCISCRVNNIEREGDGVTVVLEHRKCETIDIVQNYHYPPLSFTIRTGGSMMEHDEYMERQMRSTFKEYQNGGSVLERVVYHTERCYDMTITADRELFNTEAGSSLNEHFWIQGNCYAYVFNPDRELVFTVPHTSGITIEEYLSHSPLMMSYFSLKMLSIPAEAPCEATFILSVKLEDGELHKSIDVSVF